MNLELKFFATFREAVGQKTVEREYDDGATVRDVLDALQAEFPDLEGEFYDDGEIRETVRVLRNGRAIVHMDGAETELDGGDTLSVFPPVAGGSSLDGDPAEREESDSDPAEREESDGNPGEITVDVDRERGPAGAAVVEREFRGISKRLAVRYLEGMSAERESENLLVADGWSVEVVEGDPVTIGPTLSLTPLEVTFEGDPDVLPERVATFAQKAMRAGG